MASKDQQGRSNYNLNELITLGGVKYCFGTVNDSIPSSLFVLFRVEADSSLSALTEDMGIGMALCEVTDVKTLEEFIARVRDLFIPRFNMWLKKKFPNGLGGAPAQSGAVDIVALGNQVAARIKINDSPTGPTATL